MGLRSTLTSILSAPLATLLESRLRDIAAETLANSDYAEPAEVRALSNHLDHARTAIDELTADLDAIRDRLETLESAPEPDLGSTEHALRVATLETSEDAEAAAAEALHAGVHEVADATVALKGRVSTLAEQAAEVEARAEAAKAVAESAASKLSTLRPPEESPPPSTPEDKGCMIEGCTNKHRARGLCGRHYMMWGRGTLPGVVRKDGTIFFEEDGPVFEVGEAHRGKPGHLDGGEVVLEG